jgi:uncharacterized membrane protein YgcG
MTYREISDKETQQELAALRQRVRELEQLVEHLQAQKQRRISVIVIPSKATPQHV